MKKQLLTLPLAFVALGGFAQDLIYTHDANGNRLIHETMLLKQAPTGYGGI